MHGQAPTLLLLLLLYLVPRVAGAASTVRLAVVLGNNRGQRTSEPLRYADSDARKVYDVLRQLGGVAPGDIRLLLDASADEAWRAIRAMERRARSYSKRPDVRTLLMIYYSGHAEGGALELGRTSLRFAELTRFLRSSGADVRLAIIDSCRSGELVATKGGRRGPTYEIQVSDQMASSGYAVITSSAANELSREAAEIRGSFFTHYLVSALRGVGDNSGDGRVTLSEAYRYAYGRTVARTMATVGGGQHPMYDFKLAGHGDIVLTKIPSHGSRLTVVSAHGGRLVVLRGEGDAVVVESRIKKDRPVHLAVAPGSYQVFVVSKGTVRRAVVRIARNRAGHVGPSAFSVMRLRKGVKKGGLFRPGLVHRFGAGFLLRRMPLAEQLLAYGSAIVYRLELPIGLEPSVRLSWSTAADSGYSTGYHAVGGHLGLGYVWHLAWPALTAEVAVGYEHMFQDDAEGTRRHTSVLGYQGLVGLRLPIGPLWGQLDLGAGGRGFRLRDEGWVHRLDLQLMAGVGWRLGE